jgi:predicted deacylase
MKIKEHDLFQATPGCARRITSEHYGPPPSRSSGPHRKIYIQAALHADETPALLVAVALRKQLSVLERDGMLAAEVVLVPVANPAGLGQWVMGTLTGRFELGSGRNYNRNFPIPHEQVAERVSETLGQDRDANRALIRAAWGEAIDAWSPADEFESLQRILMQLAHDADIVLDLHCSREAAMHLYTGTAIWDQVEPLARYMGAKASLLAVDSGAKSFDEALSLMWWHLSARYGDRFPIPQGSVSVTVEHRGQRDVSYAVADRDADAIIAYLMQAGAILGDPPPLPPLLHPATPLAGSQQFNAPFAGVLVHHVDAGAHVEPGQAVFDIVCPHTGNTTTLHSATRGVLYMRRDIRFVRMGDPLGRVSGEQPRRTGNLLSA